jgi:hypothetical protein
MSSSTITPAVPKKVKLPSPDKVVKRVKKVVLSAVDSASDSETEPMDDMDNVSEFTRVVEDKPVTIALAEKQYILRRTPFAIMAPTNAKGENVVQCGICKRPASEIAGSFRCTFKGDTKMAAHPGTLSINVKALITMQQKDLFNTAVDQQRLIWPQCKVCKRCSLSISSNPKSDSYGRIFFMCGCKAFGDKVFMTLTEPASADSERIMESNLNVANYRAYISTMIPLGRTRTERPEEIVSVLSTEDSDRLLSLD